MRARRATITLLLGLAMACSARPRPHDDDNASSPRHAAEPSAGASEVDASDDATPAHDGSSALDAPGTDGSDASSDAPDDQAPSPSDAGADDGASDGGADANVCPPPYCAGSWINEYQDVPGHGCVLFSATGCQYGCVLGDAGPTCADPPPECALLYVPDAGEPCPISAGGGMCFPDAASACACKCPGKSCQIGPPQPGIKIPKLKLPKKENYPSNASDGGAPDATAPTSAASSGGDASTTDAAPDGGVLVVKCY